VTFLKSRFFVCFTAALIISPYLPHYLSFLPSPPCLPATSTLERGKRIFKLSYTLVAIRVAGQVSGRAGEGT
jgi:hypothetical protein